jgi:hypothetical protein
MTLTSPDISSVRFGVDPLTEAHYTRSLTHSYRPLRDSSVEITSLDSLAMTIPENQPARPWIHTPLLESKALSEVAQWCEPGALSASFSGVCVPLTNAANSRVFMKMDMFQPSGSFKSRSVFTSNLPQCLCPDCGPEVLAMKS